MEYKLKPTAVAIILLIFSFIAFFIGLFWANAVPIAICLAVWALPEYKIVAETKGK